MPQNVVGVVIQTLVNPHRTYVKQYSGNRTTARTRAVQIVATNTLRVRGVGERKVVVGVVLKACVQHNKQETTLATVAPRCLGYQTFNLVSNQNCIVKLVKLVARVCIILNRC